MISLSLSVDELNLIKKLNIKKYLKIKSKLNFSTWNLYLIEKWIF